VLAASKDMVVLVPVPVVVVPPGILVNVHVPDEGRLLNTTLPVETVHVVCVIVPTFGAAGVTGCVLITIPDDEGDAQPDEPVTEYVYVPATSKDMVVLVPVPVVVAPPGLLVKVHVPDEGKLLNKTLPVETVQVGCVIVPGAGATGVAGCTLITTLDDAGDTHPAELVTVYV